MRHYFFCTTKNLGPASSGAIIVGVQQNKYPAAGLAFCCGEQQVPTKLCFAVQETIFVDADRGGYPSGRIWCLPFAYST